MNIACIIGNVATDPDLRHTDAGRPICTFRVAVSRPTDADTADFFTIVTFDRQAEVCAEYLAVGRRVSIEGRLHGTDHARVDIVATRVEMLGSARRTTTA